MTTSEASLPWAALVVLCLDLVAQTPDTAILRGRISDLTHAGISGVDVEAVSGKRVIRRTRTDAAGDFTLAGLPAGADYEIIASKSGFADARCSYLTLAGGTAADIQLQLDI